MDVGAVAWVPKEMVPTDLASSELALAVGKWGQPGRTEENGQEEHELAVSDLHPSAAFGTLVECLCECNFYHTGPGSPRIMRTKTYYFIFPTAECYC